MRDGKQAVEHATRACELTAWKKPIYIDTLAASHAEFGDFDKAIEYQKKAQSFLEFEKQSGAKARQWLELFGQKKPFRDPLLIPLEVAPPRELKKP